MTDALYAAIVSPKVLIIALACVSALAIGETALLLSRIRRRIRPRGAPLTSVEAPIRPLIDELQPSVHQLQEHSNQELARLSAILERLQNSTEELRYFLRSWSSSWQSRTDEILRELSRFRTDVEAMLRDLERRSVDALFSSGSVRGDSLLDKKPQLIGSESARALNLDESVQRDDFDSKLAQISSELLSLLEKDGRSSPIAQLRGLQNWLSTRASELTATPLLNSGGLWLTVVLSKGDSDLGTVLPTLDTVIGAGSITDWFRCEGYDGTVPLHHADVLTAARAKRDSNTGAWHVIEPGRIRRQIRREGA